MRSRVQRATGRRAFLRLAAAGSTAALAGLLGACGGAPPAEEEFPDEDPGPTLPVADAALPTPTTLAPAATADSGTTLVLGHWDSALRPVLADFERSHPGVTVRFISEWVEDYHQGLRSALKQGKGLPDVAAVNLAWLGVFADRGGFADLAAAPFDGSSLQADMAPGAWEAGAVGGKQIAIPWGISPAALWYRADLLDEAGIDSDPAALQARLRSWEDLLDLGREVKRSKAERSLFFDARDLFYAAAGQSEYGWLDGNKVLIEEKGTRPAQLASLVRREKLDADLVSGNPQLALKSNELVGIFADQGLLTYLASEFAALAGSWRVIPPPGGAAVFGATFLTIPEASEQKELAWALVKFLAATPDTQNAYLKAGGPTPAYAPAYANAIYDAPVSYFGDQAAYRMWADQARQMPAAKLSPHQRDALTVVETELSQVVERDKDPEQAMLDAEAAMIRKVDGLMA